MPSFYAPRFELPAFALLDHATRIAALEHMVEALALVNRGVMRLRTIPPLYRSGVVYQREAGGEDEWLDVLRVLTLGHGDCEDLVGYRLAELRASGEDVTARPEILHYLVDGVTYYHVLVARSDGTVEDPSRALGMP